MPSERRPDPELPNPAPSSPDDDTARAETRDAQRGAQSEGTAGSATPTARLGWKAGARIGELVILEKLGKGAFGAVYLVEHHATQERFALKALPTPTGTTQERFHREALALTKAGGHPNVAKAHDMGTHGAHEYIVMEHLAGGSLEDRLAREGRLRFKEAAHIVSQLARGLQAVHETNVLHRDLKPANVMFDAAGTPKLVDFGMARLLDATSLTASGVALGTPSYMSPEQARGERRMLDPRTDTYGLGGVLYACLVGHGPHTGPTIAAVMRKILSVDPPAPSTVVPSVPPELDRIVSKALQRDQDRRFQSAKELGDALDQAFAEERSPDEGSFSPIPALVVVALCLVLGLVVLEPWADAPAGPRLAAPPVPKNERVAKAKAPGRWTLAPDQRMRLAFEWTEAPGGEWRVEAKGFMDLRVTEVQGDVAKLAASLHVERLFGESRGNALMSGGVDPDALAASRGVECVQLTLDLRTGAVSSLIGVERARDLVLGKLPAGVESDAVVGPQGRVRRFFDRDVLEGLLGLVFEPKAPWEPKGEDTYQARDKQLGASALPFMTTVSKASREARTRFTGRLQFAGGRLERARVEQVVTVRGEDWRSTVSCQLTELEDGR